MENRLPPNRFRMLDTMEDIRQNCKGRIYANMFTVKEFSKTFRIGINTVYRLCKLDGFPVIQIGGNYAKLLSQNTQKLQSRYY